MSVMRLHETIEAAGVAITGVSVPEFGNSATVTVTPPELQAAAQPVIDAFDWSQAAQAAWEIDRLRTRLSASVGTDNDELRLAVRAILRLVVTELNILRALHGLPDRTAADVRQALRNAIEAGQGDA